MLVELDSNSEKLRQKEGWYHWVVAAQEGTESSTDTGYSTSSAGMGGPLEYSTIGPEEVSSAAPSEASESIVVSASVACTLQGVGYLIF